MAYPPWPDWRHQIDSKLLKMIHSPPPHWHRPRLPRVTARNHFLLRALSCAWVALSVINRKQIIDNYFRYYQPHPPWRNHTKGWNVTNIFVLWNIFSQCQRDFPGDSLKYIFNCAERSEGGTMNVGAWWHNDMTRLGIYPVIMSWQVSWWQFVSCSRTVITTSSPTDDDTQSRLLTKYQ